jgi:hypothetical protein
VNGARNALSKGLKPMIKTRITLMFLLLALATPCMAQKAFVDWDKDYDFDSVESYAWVKPENFAENPLMNQRIINAIDYHLSMGGMREVGQNDDPDVYVTYHGSSKEQYNINSTNFGYGYGGGWYGHGYGGMGTSSSQVTSYEIGTLVIDVWDVKTKNMIWRGTASATISPKPEKMEKRINKAIAKLAKKWRQEVVKDMKAKEKAAAQAGADG